MTVFQLCDEALQLIRGKSLLYLDAGQTAALERLDLAYLINEVAQEEAVVCCRMFGSVRDTLLASHPWLFARKSEPLALLADAPHGWTFCYSMPADCRCLLWLECRDFTVPVWQVAGDHICSNFGPAVRGVYTAQCDDVNRWPALFCEAFKCSLAAAIAPAVTGGSEFVAEARNGLGSVLGAALDRRMIDGRPIMPVAQYPYEGYAHDQSDKGMYAPNVSNTESFGSWSSLI